MDFDRTRKGSMTAPHGPRLALSKAWRSRNVLQCLIGSASSSNLEGKRAAHLSDLEVRCSHLSWLKPSDTAKMMNILDAADKPPTTVLTDTTWFHDVRSC